MYNNESNFSTLFCNDNVCTVSIGDESALNVLDIGTVKALAVLNDETTNIELENVLYTSNLARNFVSVRKHKGNVVKVIFLYNLYGRGICMKEHLLTLKTVFQRAKTK